MATDNNGGLSFEVKLMLDKLQADVKKANAVIRTSRSQYSGIFRAKW